MGWGCQGNKENGRTYGWRRLGKVGAKTTLCALDDESQVTFSVLQPNMSWKRFLWLAQCLIICLLGIFVAQRLADLLNPVVWWVLHKIGKTSSLCPLFSASYYVPLIGIYGFLLGMIPIRRLQELVASSFGRLRFQSSPQQEMIFSRPILWAWAPVGLALVLRLLTFKTNAGHSVLASTIRGEGRFEHFFGPIGYRSRYDPAAWIFDRIVLTGPTVFLLAYAFGVWLRHQISERTVVPAEVDE